MGETEKDGAATKEEKHEKKEKHADEDGKGEKDEEKAKDKKKKKKDKDGGEGGKEKKEKNPEDKKDPTKLRAKLEKIDSKIQALNIKREEVLKLLNEVPSADTTTTPSA